MKAKKIIILVLCCVLSVITLAACGKKGGEPEPTPPPTPDPPVIEKTECDKACDTINDLLKQDISKLVIAISTEDSNETLSSRYEINKNGNSYTVIYSYETLNSFEKVDGVYVAPEEYKTKHMGTVKVTDGVVVQQDGESANIPLDNITNVGLTFADAYLNNEVLSTGKLEADVSNVNSFLGTNLNCSNMTVAVEYSSTKISNIVIRYTSSGSKTVNISYTFS